MFVLANTRKRSNVAPGADGSVISVLYIPMARRKGQYIKERQAADCCMSDMVCVLRGHSRSKKEISSHLPPVFGLSLEFYSR